MERKKRKSRFWGIFCILISLLFLGCFLIIRDIAPIDDSDLALPERKIDPKQNPLPMIRKMEIDEDRLENLKRVNQMVQDKAHMDVVFIDSIIKDFAEELALFDRYAAMTDWKVVGDIQISSTFPEISTLLVMGKLKQAEIRRDLDRNEVELAIQKTINLMKLGVRLQNCDGTMLHHLVGVAITTMAHVLFLEMIDKKDLNSEALELLMEKMEKFKVSTNSLINTLRLEYQIFTPIIEEVANGKTDLIRELSNDRSTGPPNFFVFKKNRTKLLLAEAYRNQIREVPMIRKNAPKAVTKRIDELRNDEVKMWFSGNAVGQILLSLSISSLDRALDANARARAYHQLLRIRIAMERYRLSKGNWPPDLKTLVPEFIDAIPIDPMDGEPLRYNKTTLKIYSVGLDFIDDKGVADRPGLFKGKNEIVIELEPKKDNE